jgi:LmbE family N-acetylglucosaminyl deacetylase
MSTLRSKPAGALLAVCLLIVAQEPAIAQSIGSQQSKLAAFTQLSFYVGGHQDDWQLFRGNAAYNDLTKATAKVVFIYATAGDAGRTDGWWEARERGAVAAVRKVVGPSPLTVNVSRFNDHPILRYTCGNSVSYFLRLPDGQYGSGRGYPAYDNESLLQLRGDGKPVSAVDKSTTYKSWKDFWQTLRAIMDYERSQVPAAAHPWINAPDYFGTDNSQQDCHSRKSCNPCDHPDHNAVGEALRQFVAGTYDRAWWVGYDTMNRPENLKGADFVRKGEVFLAYGAAVLNETTANGNPARPELEEWQAWGARDYARTVSWDQPDPDNPHCGQ